MCMCSMDACTSGREINYQYHRASKIMRRSQGQDRLSLRKAYDFKINPNMVANFESIKGKQVLDVRDTRFFDKGHIPESV